MSACAGGPLESARITRLLLRALKEDTVNYRELGLTTGLSREALYQRIHRLRRKG